MGSQVISEPGGESVTGGLEMRDRVPVQLRHQQGAHRHWESPSQSQCQHKGFSGIGIAWQLGAKQYHKGTPGNKPHTRDFLGRETELRLLLSGNRDSSGLDREGGFDRVLEHAQRANGKVRFSRKYCLAGYLESRGCGFPNPGFRDKARAG